MPRNSCRTWRQRSSSCWTMKPRKREQDPDGPGAVSIEPPIRRGDILWISCDPSVGAEPRKTRTCVVVSNDFANRFGQAITIVPTQAYSAERAGRAYMTDLRRPRSTLAENRVANASMVMTYDRRRIVKRAGKVMPQTLADIDRALAVHLALSLPDPR
ncbi:MAG: type II toxin-antitoxin system PemK/MazF family toxin [Deltaproteobacteria bacterium]|nr:MAG: type II toxin-antitoxin system PemK/MazF family toxin [Deltaproteobacteria bacterium]TMQ09895.1 MAG: type II toxin-antitoxin system PemK/MazF family toxin [Deltaproteobacteria bacterium]